MSWSPIDIWLHPDGVLPVEYVSYRGTGDGGWTTSIEERPPKQLVARVLDADAMDAVFRLFGDDAQKMTFSVAVTRGADGVVRQVSFEVGPTAFTTSLEAP